MCGLAGMMGRGIGLKHREAFKDLLHCSALRGREGTGVMVANTRGPKNSQPRIYKSIRDSPDFIYDHGGNTGFLSSGMWDVFLGHCRWPTKGAVNHKNVHPWDVGPIVGAHNGTLESPEFFVRGMTDSEAMFRTMVSKGIVPTLSDTEWYDAWAVSIYEKESQSIFLGTNGQRPLSIGVVQDEDVVMWASETLMLYSCAERNKVDIQVYKLTPYRLYEISMDSIRAGVKTPWINHDVEKPKIYTRNQVVDFPKKDSSASTPTLDDGIPF